MVDKRDAPPVKAVLMPAARHVHLTFDQTIMLHKSGSNTAYPLSVLGHHPKFTRNANSKGVVELTTGFHNSQETSNSGSMVIDGVNIAVLECWRPLIYEPVILYKSVHNAFVALPGSRQGRKLPWMHLKGGFTIRMIEGTNKPEEWANHINSSGETGGDRSGKDGFGATQYVRVICLLVKDMGDGYGIGTSNNATLQQTNMVNFRNDEASGIGDAGQVDICRKHLLVPNLGDIFDKVHIDPDNDYNLSATEQSYMNEDMVSWKFKTHNRNTPKAGQTVASTSEKIFDPYRGHKKSRKFTVLHDEKVAFKAYGSQSDKFNNGLGAREHEVKWDFTLRNTLFQMPDVLTTVVHRSSANMSQRLIWYFIPSISNRSNGNLSGSVEYDTKGHHGFHVTSHEEKIWWTEKQDSNHV